MTTKRLIHGIGNRSGMPTTVIGSNGKSKLCPIYQRWYRLLSDANENKITVDDELADLRLFSDHIKAQGYEPNKHRIVDLSYFTTLTGDCTVTKRLCDIIVVKKEHTHYFISKRPERELPFWVHYAGGVFRAQVTMWNRNCWERKEGERREGKKTVKLGKDPIVLHLWAIERKIENFLYLMREYESGSAAQIGMNNVIETLKKAADLKAEYIPSKIEIQRVA
ncbi:hypothetical protein [Vibrio phage BONAISHI]|nr:hypothetical protein [Vibrio phage BONAISHI]